MSHSFSRDRDTIVNTSKGMVQGYFLDGLTIFKGIPYAKAKRFHAPVEIEPFEGIFDAGSYGYVAPLLTKDNPNLELFIPHRYWPTDENCQNLNIWTPSIKEGKRPVLVWLHGGGFFAGSSIEQIAYDGANLAKLADVVVVSLNHRLNILGYLDLSEYSDEYINSANAGGDDIIAALEWIQKNIAAFGGDPENVMVFGQSGGGAKVTTLLQSPKADGLYHKGMIMSGVLDGLMDEKEGSARPLVDALLKELKLADVKELETIDFYILAKAYTKVSESLKEAGHYVGCAPKKNEFYTGNPIRYGFRKETENIPLLIGSTYGEFTLFAGICANVDKNTITDKEAFVRKNLGEKASIIIDLFKKSYPKRDILDLFDLDFRFRLPQIEYTKLRSKNNNCTFSYLFNMDQPIDGRTVPWHCCDIAYFFHNIDLMEYPYEKGENESLSHKLQEEMFGAMIAFARTNNPKTPLLPKWEACSEDKENTMIFDEDTRVLENFDHALIKETAEALKEIIEQSMKERREALKH